jgi:tetratricopeptide (TPR) repeat protein
MLIFLTATIFTGEDAISGATDMDSSDTMSSWNPGNRKKETKSSTTSNLKSDAQKDASLRDMNESASSDRTTSSEKEIPDIPQNDTISGATDDGVTMETIDESQQYYRFTAEGDEETKEIVDISETVIDDVVEEIDLTDVNNADKSDLVDSSDAVTGASENAPDMYEVLNSDSATAWNESDSRDNEIELVDETTLVDETIITEDTEIVDDTELVLQDDQSSDVIAMDDRSKTERTWTDTITVATDDADMESWVVDSNKDTLDVDESGNTDLTETDIAVSDSDDSKDTLVVKKDSDDSAESDESTLENKESTYNNEAFDQLLKDLEEKKRLDRNRINRVDDAEFDRLVLIDNSRKESSMILFSDEIDDTPPSLRGDFESETQTMVKPWYSSDTFVPQTYDEFMTMTPPWTFDEAGILEPGSLSINRELGETVFNEAYQLYKEGQITAAMQRFEKLYYYNYRPLDASYYISWCYYIKKDYSTSVNFMLSSVNLLDGENIDRVGEYYFHIGNIYYQLENYSGSLQYYKQALDVNAGMYKVYNGVGLAYYKMGNVKSALDAWKSGKEGGDYNCRQNYTWLSRRLK